MTSYILENSFLVDNIQYEWNISGLHAISQPLDGFSNIIRKIDWNLWAKLEVSGQTYAEFIYGDVVFDISNLDLNSDTFISYENLTLDNVVSWIEEGNPTIRENLKNKLLDRKIYITNMVSLPWQTSQTVETEEPAATTEEPVASEPAATTEEPAATTEEPAATTEEPAPETP
jgi:hypothetical protein